MNSTRGYYGIGIDHSKTVENLGTLWRSAYIFGASFVFTIGRRYKQHPTDTLKSIRHIPLYHYIDLLDFYSHMPYDCRVIGVELDERSTQLQTFVHPQRCIYLLGAEDHGLTKEARNKCHMMVQLPGEYSLNVAVCGSIVLYDRISKGESQ